MKRTTTSDQIAAALKQEELGMPLEDVIRQAGVSEHTFLSWKKRYSALPGFPQDLKCLQEENVRLKQIVAEMALENSRLKDSLEDK
ncbi:transposase [Herminiimonas fonticola]|uniref:Putative transposase n=1 Tax=Herminiimonas fonticola TaxID=303380 RepID=A0A4R6G1M5_9BURK|nr:transposase [Herminiimonas fonticola]RBA23492.1 Transposase [Herminiimonas fonticola]TDN88253.1 putative transposase [Herminiimonas fonticola]